MTGSSHSLPKQKPVKGKKIPGYLHHKSTGQARVRIDGRDYYLGPYGSDASRVEYGNLVAKHAGGISVDPLGKSVPESGSPTASGLTVNELTLAFMRHADTHYRKGGKPTSEIDCLKLAIRPLVELYGTIPADQFGPLALKAVRERMIANGWVRRSVNCAIGRIRHVFRFGVGNELVDPATLQKLQAVEPLLAGRTAARDNPPRTGVSDDHINAVRAEVSELVRDLIDLQRLIGARSGELLSLTTAMIDRSGPVWTARLDNHKTVHHGHHRNLAIGPKAQLVLTKYLSANAAKPLFDIEGHSYCRAITRVCTRLKIPRWVPHQLRNTAASAVRDAFGLEHTQAVLGHASADMSEHYARVSQNKAAEVALKIG